MINREEIFKNCKDKYYSDYDEGFIWEVVNIVCNEVELEITKD